MAQNNEAFSLRLIENLEGRLGRVPRINSPETYSGPSGQLHPEGLFSIPLLGEPGTPARDYTFGYIKLNTRIMHPQVCKWLKQIKRLNEEVWQGKTYAIFNKKTGEFEKTDGLTGDTGYHFFVSHLSEMKFKKNESAKRNQTIKALERYRDNYFLENYLVLPAGLRDIMIDENGKATEDEINEIYRKMLRIAITLQNTPRNQGAEMNQVRVSLQQLANECDLYIDTILSGKRGFLAGKWASRRLHLSSRNVISAQDPSCDDLDSPNRTTVDTVQWGLFQAMVACKPLVVNAVRKLELIQQAFSEGSYTANLLHPTTYEQVVVQLDPDEAADWTTIEGIEKLIKKFEKQSFRHLPIMIRGYYLGLVYRDEEKYQVLSNIDELPEGWSQKHVHPITYLELFHIVTSDVLSNVQAQITRYPVTGEDSVFIGETQIKTTVSMKILEKYERGQKVGFRDYGYPDMSNLTYLESLSIPNSRVPGLGADLT